MCNDWHNRFARNCLVSKSDLSFSTIFRKLLLLWNSHSSEHWITIPNWVTFCGWSWNFKKEIYWQLNIQNQALLTRQNKNKIQLCVMIGTTDSHAIVSYQNLICRFHRQKCLCNCRVSLFLEKNFAQIVYVHNLNVYQTWCFYFYIFRRLSVW